VSVPVTRLSKWKTTIQMIAIGILVVGDAGPRVGPFTSTEVGVCGLWAAAALTLVTGYDYLRAGFRHMDAHAASRISPPIERAKAARDVG
jgi:cardiolipin synthase